MTSERLFASFWTVYGDVKHCIHNRCVQGMIVRQTAWLKGTMIYTIVKVCVCVWGGGLKKTGLLAVAEVKLLHFLHTWTWMCVLCGLSWQDQGMKAPSAVSQQWGSYFVDMHKSGGGDEEYLKLTWCCHCIHKYSTMAIPSVEHIASMSCCWCSVLGFFLSFILLCQL